MPKKYCIKLKKNEREEFVKLLKKPTLSQRKRLHAQILLKADESKFGPGWNDKRIADAFETSISTVERTREKCVKHGIKIALEGHPSPRVYRRKLDGEGEAKLIALCCGEAPEGRDRWTLKLLGDKLVELKVVERISETAVRETLKKMNLSLG